MGCGSSVIGDGLNRPKELVKSIEWPIRDDFVFPELRNDEDGLPALQGKPSFAVCLSGGGYRATSCALGWIRALHKLGYLKQARYLTSNSGGSWFNVCFSYQHKVPNKVFLGTYTPPEKLTVAVASKHRDGSYGKVVSDGTMVGPWVRGILKEILSADWAKEDDTRRLRAWSEAVGHAFLRQHGIDLPNAAFALTGKSAERAAANTHTRVFTACRSKLMPFPIVVSCLAPAGDPNFFESYEFTPLYSGVPVRRIETVHQGKPVLLGGHLVESFAASADGPKIKWKKKAKKEGSGGRSAVVKVKSHWTVPPVQMAGMSSQFIAQNFVDSRREGLWEVTGCPELFYWEGVHGRTFEVGTADGAGTDNLAILPALRRGVKALLICVAANAPPGLEIEEAGGGTRAWETEATDVAGYFGCVPAGSKVSNKEVDAAGWRRHLKVFEGAAFDELKQRCGALQRQGKPVAVRLRLRVLRNEQQGVAGGYEADTLWLFHAGFEEWRGALPEDSRVQVALEAHKEGFPYMPSSDVDYTSLQVAYLSQLASWNVMQVKEEVASLVHGAR